LHAFTRPRWLSLSLTVVSLITGAGCGSGGRVVLNSSTGNFTNASLKGSYVYQIQGASVVSAAVYREAGVFVADGVGKITGGVDDSSINVAGTAVTGTYTVSPDGTGFLAMSTSVGQITLAITLVSSSKLYLMEDDTTLNAAGSAELQDPQAAGTTPGGTFVFRLHQEASAENQSQRASQVGELMIQNGTATGNMDQNLGGTLTSPTLSSTFLRPSPLGRGMASIMDSSANFTTSLVYYIVNGGKMVLLVTNSGAVGSGSAELVSGNVSAGLSGNYAFGSRGDDTSSLYAVATVGQFTASSSSISGAEDAMQDGNYSPSVSFSNCSSSQSSGRVVVTNCSSATPLQVFWLVSASRAFFLDNTSGRIEDGTADLQNSSAFSTSALKGQFALVMQGIDISPELLSRVGTMQFDGIRKLGLTELVNASALLAGGQSPGALSGTYAVSSNGRVTASLNSGGLDLVMYAVSPSIAYVLQANSGVMTSGTIELQ
jgi:hypothetical protein